MPNYDVEARSEYEKALKQGQREMSQAGLKVATGGLRVLDDQIDQAQVMAYMKQPRREIPLSQVVGTYTSARAHSFSPGFMPLHPLGSEFASKWISLCGAHMAEGLRDPIQVYEYMWQYYVIEGNKRVSVLKHFDAPAIMAEITRVIPQMDRDDPQAAVYYAFLQYDKQGLFKNIRLSSAEKYTKLRELELKLLPELAFDNRPDFNAMFLQFEYAYQQSKNSLPLGDAFLEYLKIYGFLDATPLSEILERITALSPQLSLVEHPEIEPQIMLDPAEERTPGLVERLFSQPKTARVLFAYEEGRTETNWIGAHEKGRLAVQQNLGERVMTSFVDNLTPDNCYDLLTEASEGADLVLVTSARMHTGALRFALEHPDCITLIYSRVRQDYRLSTYYGRYYEAVFLCGVAAGLRSRTGRIAYLTPYQEVVRHTADINAFGQGVKSVRSDAQVYLINRRLSDDISFSCEEGLRRAAERSADVAMSPVYPRLNLPGRPDGVFSCVLSLDGAGVPQAFLAAPSWDWGRYYTEIVKSYLNGSMRTTMSSIDRSDPTVTGLWWGLGAGVLRLVNAPGLHPASENLLQYLRGNIALSRFNPFRGPIMDKEGNVIVPDKEDPSPSEVLKMHWLADYIELVE